MVLSIIHLKRLMPKLRTKFAVYVFLNALSVTFQVPPALWITDMNDTLMPCNEAEWECPTAETWSIERQHHPHQCLRFSEAMIILYSPDPWDSVKFSMAGSYMTLHAVVQQITAIQRNIWSETCEASFLESAERAISTWRKCADDVFAASSSGRQPQRIMNINAVSLYRLAYVRLCGDFGPIRAAIATHDLGKIVESLSMVEVNLTRSATCLIAARCAVDALRAPVQLGMAFLGGTSGWYHKHTFILYSVECCECFDSRFQAAVIDCLHDGYVGLFSSVWLRDQLGRAHVESNAEEREIIDTVREILKEFSFQPPISQRPLSIQLIHAWAIIFERCAGPSISLILAEALRAYADT